MSRLIVSQGLEQTAIELEGVFENPMVPSVVLRVAKFQPSLPEGVDAPLLFSLNGAHLRVEGSELDAQKVREATHHGLSLELRLPDGRSEPLDPEQFEEPVPSF